MRRIKILWLHPEEVINFMVQANLTGMSLPKIELPPGTQIQGSPFWSAEVGCFGVHLINNLWDEVPPGTVPPAVGPSTTVVFCGKCRQKFDSSTGLHTCESGFSQKVMGALSAAVARNRHSLQTIEITEVTGKIELPEAEDVVPTMLSPGVSYVSKEMIEKFGVESLKRINEGGKRVRFACGVCSHVVVITSIDPEPKQCPDCGATYA